MTDHIADDLAALGRRARDRLPPVATTLERLAPRAELPAERALLVLSRAFCDRVARGAAGGMALALMVVVVGYLAFPHPDQNRFESWIGELTKGPQFALWATALGVVMATHQVAARIAARTFDRAIAGGDMLARARALVERVGNWTLGLAVAGAMSYVLVFGMLRVELGIRAVQDLSIMSEVWHALSVEFTLTLVALIAVAVAGGALVARGLALGHRAVIGGVVLLLVTMALGLQLDAGYLGPEFRHAPLEAQFSFTFPSIDGVRDALTCAGTLAVFLIVGGAFARRHRREIAGI